MAKEWPEYPTMQPDDPSGGKRYSDETIFKIAKRYNAPLIFPDTPISRRKLRHCVFNADNEPLLYSRDFVEVVQFCLARDMKQVVILTDDPGRPIFARLATRLHGFWRGKQDG